MKFVRTSSTRRLLAVIAGLVAAIIAGTAIAIAATGRGPVPPSKPLASAVRGALAAKPVNALSARIRFTNHLIDSSDIQGADPLLTGGSGRLWLSAAHGLRLELQSDAGDSTIVVNRGSFWAYDAGSNTVYEGRLPADTASGTTPKKAGHDALPTLAQIRTAIARLSGQATVSGAVPGDVAGRPAYTVRVSPRDQSGLFGGAALAWDAARGVPLRFSIFARGESAPVLELAATNISYAPVAASVFSMSPPKNAKIVKVDVPSPASSKAATRARRGAHQRPAQVTGVTSVASRVHFALDAPATAGGRSLSHVRLLGRGAKAGALLSYGQGIGGVYVIERPAAAGKASTALPGSARGDGPGLSLPTLSVRGASAQELDTALGSIVRFDRGGVSYIVLGSAPRATVQGVARSL